MAFDLPAEANTEITVFTLSGKKYRSIEQKKLLKGRHVYEMNSAEMQNGMYIIRLNTDSGTAVQLLKILH